MGRPRTRSARATSVASRMVSQSACRFMETVKWRQEDWNGLGRRCLLAVPTKVKDRRKRTYGHGLRFLFAVVRNPGETLSRGKKHGIDDGNKDCAGLHSGKSQETEEPLRSDSICFRNTSEWRWKSLSNGWRGPPTGRLGDRACQIRESRGLPPRMLNWSTNSIRRFRNAKGTGS